MATHDEEHQRHREILAAILLPFAAGHFTGSGVASDFLEQQATIVGNAFKMADAILAFKGTP